MPHCKDRSWHKSLTTYRKKRDFEKTAEPSGDVKVAPSKQRRFVIQKHDATRLHYDLRLELDGVFKSWAVTRGPSLDPHDKRLAVEVEDHPLDYGDFEGTIPKGQYGGGTVQLWDRGYWDRADDPERGFAKGDLKFALEGEQLHGGWVLVRMKHDRNGGKRTNWLLIKHRDEFAREGEANDVLDEDRSVASGRTMAADRRRQGQGAKAVHDWRRAARPRPTRSGIPTAATAAKRARRRKAAAARSRPRRSRRRRADAGLRRAAALRLGRAAAERARLGATRSSSTAIACSCGSRTARSTLKTRKGLDWTDKFPAIAKAAAQPAGLHHRRRDRRARRERRAGLRGPAGGAVRRQDRRSDLLRLRPAVRRRRGSARAAACASARRG